MPAGLAVKSYRDLQVWQKAMALVVESYSVARLLPKSESFGLIGQMQRQQCRFLPTSLRDTEENIWVIMSGTFR